MHDLIPVRRALISVSDKSDLLPLARRLVAFGTQIISTGGTAKALMEAGIPVTPIDQVTGFPEMMDGRLKTLHPRIHGGLLALRDHADHVQAMQQHGIEPIDLVCVNLYPFEKTTADPHVAQEQAIEQIDIGGPSMIRSAAKNHRYVAVVTDPAQYDQVCHDLEQHKGATSLRLRQTLASAAFARTASYDTAIAAWMQGQLNQSTPNDDPFPSTVVLRLNCLEQLRYGENPHQQAAVYQVNLPGQQPEPSVIGARQLHGKELSFNNLYDASAALELVKEFHAPAAAVIKHTNPCGCAIAGTLAQAFENAYAGDPLAAFGGIVAFNRKLDVETATALTQGQKFLEVILAPDYDVQALDLLRQRWQNVRLLAVGDLPAPDRRDARRLDLKWIIGGVLVQQRDLTDMTPTQWKLAAGPSPDQTLADSLVLAWCAAKHVKSNAITIAKNGMLVGVGAGQMDRLESCKIAVEKAQKGGTNRAQGAVAASDAFFPFRDGPDTLIAAGIKAIVQPGGSKRDDETIKACQDAGVSLLFTGQRHFRH